MKRWNWKRLGIVFNPFDHITPSWMDSYAQSPSVIVCENYIRVFFSTREPPIGSQYISYPAYVDLANDNSFKVIKISDNPLMNLGKKGCFDEFGIYPFSTIRHPQKENVVYAYYAGWTRCVSVPFNVSIGCAISNDGGNSFQRLHSGPIIPYTQNEPFILSSPRIRFFEGVWHLFYISGESWQIIDEKKEPVYKIRHAYSIDQKKWKKMDRNIINPILNTPEAQASPDVFFYDGMYHMFFCYRSIYNYKHRPGSYQLGYASSTDLITWERNDSLTHFINPPSEGDFDFDMQSYPHLFSFNNKIYMLYMGNMFGKFGFALAENISE